MGKFIKRVFLLFLIVVSVLFASVLLIENYTTQDSVLAAFPDKIAMLEEKSPPRIIFIGGSNLSFGLDSKKIEDTFQIPVINMGLHAGVGFRLMMKSVEPYIQKSDIIVLVPEYADYYNENYFGNIEAVAILFDIYPKSLKYVSFRQWLHLSLISLKYAANKITSYHKAVRWALFKKENPNMEPGIYDKKSFNEYGDAYIHWNKPNRPFLPRPKSSGNESINYTMLREVKAFTEYLTEIGATYIILPPCMQQTSYDNQILTISSITGELYDNDTPFLCQSENYSLPDSLFFNSPYHLNKQGVDIRTDLIIKDLRHYISGITP